MMMAMLMRLPATAAAAAALAAPRLLSPAWRQPVAARVGGGGGAAPWLLLLPPRHHQTLTTGASFSLRRVFAQAEVEAFASLTGDANPIHRSPGSVSGAAAAQQEPPIVPGMLLASLFPAIIGSTFPGALYASQTLKFRRPAAVGSEVVAEVTVSSHTGSRVAFETAVRDAAGRMLVDGTALAVIRGQCAGS
jgi:3-hydroxybutyryl-CoA dehydratase